MKANRLCPPRLAVWILKRFLPKTDAFSLSGDYKEIYLEIAKKKGRVTAWLWFWAQVFLSIPRFIHQSYYWKLVMTGNHFKIGIRNMIRHKGFSLINIAGLALGMAGFIVIFSFIRFELSFDDFHSNRNRIFRLVEKQTFQGQEPQHLGQTTPWMGETLTEYPEVSMVVNFIDIGNTQVRYQEENFEIEHSLLADPDIFEMFSFELIRGRPETALAEPYTAVITKNTSERLFGNQDPLGNVLLAGNGHEYKIAGVVKDTPRNSHIRFDILYSIEETRLREPNWEDYNHYSPTYLLLKTGADPKSLESKFPGHMKNYMPRDAHQAALTLQALPDIHLRSQHIMWEINQSKSDIMNVYFFSMIAILILLIACINSINLTTARSITRAKEVGIRKVIGAHRSQLVKQFLGESLILSLFAFFTALAIVEMVKTPLNNLLSQSTSFKYVTSAPSFLGFLAFLIFIGSAAGIYPALVLSAFRPSAVLKGVLSGGGKGYILRRVLVVSQFAVSIALIISTILVSRQLNFMRNRNPGFNREHVVTLPMNTEMQLRFRTIREELVKAPEIQAVTASTLRLGTSLWRNIIHFEGAAPEERWVVPYMAVDYDFLTFYDLKITQGRNFSPDFGQDLNGTSYIINETLAKKLGWEDPVGRKFSHGSSDWGTVIGVLEDFNYRSFHHSIEPLVLFIRPDFLFQMSVKIDSGKTAEAVRALEKMWQTYNPELGFKYSFLDKKLEELYISEERSSKLFSLFAAQAIFISCLGLFALAAFTVEQRTREIGIRKVLGSSVPELLILLSKDFIKWVAVANLFAWPVAWYLMRKWLDNFAFRINPDAGVFVLGASLALFISGLTVGFQILRAAGADPVDSLRHE